MYNMRIIIKYLKLFVQRAYKIFKLDIYFQAFTAKGEMSNGVYTILYINM